MATTTKSYKVTPSARQRRAASNIVDIIRGKQVKTKKQALIDSGYSATQATKPSVVTESKGFLVALAELGLTKELVVSALQEDIKAKVGRRAFELSIAGKWLGLEQKGEVVNSGTMIQNAVIVVQAPKQVDN